MKALFALAGRPWARQALRFALVGVSNTLLDVALFSLLALAGAPLPLANVLSYCGGLAWSFVLNGRWTFRDRTGDGAPALSGRTGLRFLVVGLSSLGLSTALLLFFAQWLPAVPAKLLTVPFVFVFGFTLSKFFVFLPRARLEEPN